MTEVKPTEDRTAGPRWVQSPHHPRVLYDSASNGGIIECDGPEVAAYIATACNAYEPMREALAKLLRYFGSPQGVSMAELGRDASVSLEMKVRIGDLMDAHAALSTLPVIDRQNTTDDVGILREVLEEELVWHDERDESLSKQPPTGEKGWRRAEHQERIDVIRAALKAAPQPASSPDAVRLEELLIAAYTRGANWAWENTESSKEYVGKAARDYVDYTMNAPASEAGKLSTDEVTS